MPVQNAELILTALYDLRSKTNNSAPLSVTELLKELKVIIVEEFDAESSLEHYKRVWINRIHTVASDNGFSLFNRRPSWVAMEDELLNKSSDNPASNTAESSNEMVSVASRRPSSGSCSVSSSLSASSSSTTISYVLTPDDKEYVNSLYNSLKPSNMWTLSTGTVVEKKMEELAKKCVVEHPCHSLIFDLEDETWSDYFTEDELEEIQDHKYKNLPAAPQELEDYLCSLSPNDDIQTMHRELFSTYYDPLEHPSCYWAQISLVDGLDLLRSNFFGSNEHSERDYVTRVWKMMLAVHNYSNITAREEIYSKKRNIDSISLLARKQFPIRPDHLYSCEETELGFLKAAEKSDESGNKEYKDAYLKSPKTMKHFLLQLTKSNPEFIHDIRVPCLITCALDVKMLILDCPEGYVCRVASTETYYYPSKYSSFLRKMTRCLKLGWMMKSIMEETLSTLASPTDDDINMKKKRRFEVPFSFVRGNKESTYNGDTSSSSSS